MSEKSDAIAAALRKAILRGDYADGERLSQSRLALKYGAHRSVVSQLKTGQQSPTLSLDGETEEALDLGQLAGLAGEVHGGHAELPRCGHVGLGVVHEHAIGGGTAELGGGEFEDGAFRLAQAYQVRDHHNIE